MGKKLSLFYRLAIWMIAICLSSHILVKTIIWSSASVTNLPYNKTPSLIAAFESTPWVRYKYATKQKEKFFKATDYLLPPAFSMLFILIAVKLVKTPNVFEEKD